LEPQDSIAPTTVATITGASGNNGWYLSDASVSLSASDNDGGTGVFKTEYSLDGGKTWDNYTSSLTFNTEGVSDFLFRSEDFVGNIEETKSLAIKIDKTPPEAKIYFDRDNQSLKVEGTDNMSLPTVAGQDKIFIISDEAGHTLKLFFGALKQSGKEIKAELKSVQYDGGAIINAVATLNYQWSLNKDDSIKELEQKIDIGKEKIQAKYNYNKNETKIRDKPNIAMSGLIIIKLTIKSGSLEFEYGQ
jgi:hypothetical protein